MKRTAFVVAIVSGLIVSLVFGAQVIQLVEANGYIIDELYVGPPIITIESPLSNEVVSFDTGVVSFTLTRPGYNWTSINGTSNIVVYVDIIVDGAVYSSVDVNSKLSVPFTYSLDLTDLQNGVHRVQLDAYCKGVSTTTMYPAMYWETVTSYNALSDVVSFFTVNALSHYLLMMPSENNEYSSSKVPSVNYNFAEIPIGYLHTSSEVPLDFISTNASDFSYSLDGADSVSINGNTTLKGVPDGVHSIVLYGKTLNGLVFSSEPFSFWVDTGEPQITFLSIENNTTYHTLDLELIFHLSESSPEIKYTLNGDNQIQTAVINGNTSLLNLPSGSYSLVLSARDSVSTHVSFQSVDFSIENPSPVLLLVGTFSVIIISIVLLVYFKKRKH